ncbi:MAG: hypothetical protein AVDCRST_MAG49-5, partial [uncultured Thermomicrobiales bacterium]
GGRAGRCRQEAMRRAGGGVLLRDGRGDARDGRCPGGPRTGRWGSTGPV